MGRSLAKFTLEQAGELERLYALAQDLCGEHYQMGQDEMAHLPCEVRTLSQLGQEEIREDGILADVARWQYQDKRFGRNRDLYRVNLQDHNILKRQVEDGLCFPPFMLYILTHELIHVIRFVKFLVPFHLEEADRPQEEQRVHELTRKLMAQVPLAGMELVLKNYEFETADFSDREG